MCRHKATQAPGLSSRAPSAACQIARISAATSVCPVGLYTAAEEDGGGVVLAEEFAPPAQAVLGTPAGWCHRCPPLRLPGVRGARWYCMMVTL